jgi:hypothetical protein
MYIRNQGKAYLKLYHVLQQIPFKRDVKSKYRDQWRKQVDSDIQFTDARWFGQGAETNLHMLKFAPIV